MGGRSINENENKQRDYITFLEQVLDVCVALKDKLDSGYKQVFFREKGAEHDWYMTQGDGWGNHLSCCIYNAIAFGTKQLEISQSIAGEEVETIPVMADFNIICDETDEGEPEKQIRAIMDGLQRGFIDDRITNRLEKDSSAFFALRNQLWNKKSVFSLEKNEVENYLEAYYKLLVSCVISYDALNRSNDRDSLIDILLHMDSAFDEVSGNYRLSFWSPVILNKLQKVNYGVELFYSRIAEEKTVESKILQKIYKRTLLIKAQHSFRWYISGRDHELLHAAISPYVENISNNLTFQIIARSLRQYNSYEGIGELRLGEKILYEYGLLEEDHPTDFRVAIMGDLHLNPLEELYRYVCKKANERYGKSPFMEFNIYTKNDMGTQNGSHIICCGAPDEALYDRNELERVIKHNNVVFILDCIELYGTPGVTEPESLEFIKQKYAFSAYNEYSIGSFKKADICECNALEELYEIMTGEQCFKKFGKITKPANESLLEFCEQKQKERGKESSIYIYVSDLHAFDKIYNDDQYYIRTERYNQKEIGIIRYSSENVTQLKPYDKDKMLVFNMWQFIKNVAIDEKNELASFKCAEQDMYMEFDKIHIGIDYTDWPNLLAVHYYCEDEQYEQTAVKFIEDVLLPVLNNRNQDMFNIYIRKAMHSFFYSAAKNVSDMLFVHLFQDRENLLGKVILAETNNPDNVERNINRRFKYSSKRFYDMIMKNYDISSNSYIGQIKTSQIIQKKGMKDTKIVKEEIYRNVIRACRNLSYENGYLAENCKREL